MSEQGTLPRIVVSGLGSGAGKTSLCVGLVGALRRRGLRVAVFKAGPDYLDPSYLARASGQSCHNLDLWMMGSEACAAELSEVSTRADIAIIEGVMGLFDGARPESDEGSTAELAHALGAPVVLCVDAGGMARTLASIVQGVRAHDPALQLAGVVANHVGSERHAAILRRALSSLDPVTCLLGALPKQAGPSFPSRHLGLRTARDGYPSREVLDAWADAVELALDLDALLAAAARATQLPRSVAVSSREAAVTRCRIGIAQDAAFHFYYPYNLRALQDAGAELVPFSPLSDPCLPDVDGLILGGGYPELFAERLSGNERMREDVRSHIAAGRPAYAECGGLMYLADDLVDLRGARHRMVGCVAGTVVMHERIQALGYVELTTSEDGILGPDGSRLRGHQFRYSNLESAAPPHRYTAFRRSDGHTFPSGHGARNLWASYVHAHWASAPATAEHFVSACEAVRANL